MTATSQILHASCVAYGRRGLLIRGPSGAGKSTLALQLMGLGCALIADDRVQVSAALGGGLTLTAPRGLPSYIEARGFGLLNAALQPEAELCLILDLIGESSQPLPPRLPPMRHTCLLNVAVEVVQSPLTSHLPFVIRQYLVAGRGE